VNATPNDGLWQPRGTFARWLVLAAMGVNLVASLAMALILRDATAAGGDPVARMAFIHAHPVLVTASWYGWILASLGLVTIIFVVLRSLPGRPALHQLILTFLVIGAVPDIMNNAVGAALLPHLAARYADADPALQAAIVLDFEVWDRFSVLLTGVIGNLFYGVAGFCLAFAASRVASFPRALVWLQIPLWTATWAMVAASVADSVPALIASVASTMTLFCLWCVGVAFLWLGRPDATSDAD